MNDRQTVLQALKGRVALVTGASGGIGRAIACRLAADGLNLVLCGRSAAALEETAALAAQQGAGCRLLCGDLREDACLESCVPAALESFGRLDVLVNNAGQALSAPFEQTTAAQLDALLALNLRAPYLLCRQALPALRQSGWGTVINICSVQGVKGYPLQSAYAASKHGLLGFSKSLAAEVAADGIRVHVLCPGAVDTPMVHDARPELDTAGMIAPEDIAELAAFLLEQRGNAVVDCIEIHRLGKQPFA